MGGGLLEKCKNSKWTSTWPRFRESSKSRSRSRASRKWVLQGRNQRRPKQWKESPRCNASTRITDPVYNRSISRNSCRRCAEGLGATAPFCRVQKRNGWKSGPSLFRRDMRPRSYIPLTKGECNLRPLAHLNTDVICPLARTYVWPRERC